MTTQTIFRRVDKAQLLTSSEVAYVLGISPFTLSRHRRKGTGFRIPYAGGGRRGARIRYLAWDVAEAMASQRRITHRQRPDKIQQKDVQRYLEAILSRLEEYRKARLKEDEREEESQA